MRFMLKTLLLLGSCFLFMACPQKDDGYACTEEFIYGLSISLSDSVTGEFITEDVTIEISDGDFSEELMTFPESTSFFGAGERPGNYTISVIAEGYQEFISAPIEVNANECHVIPESRTFELQPI